MSTFNSTLAINEWEKLFKNKRKCPRKVCLFHHLEKSNTQILPYMPFLPSKIKDKFCVANSFLQFEFTFHNAKDNQMIDSWADL